MMYGKAIFFGDHEKANEILHAQTPKEVKALGRQVSGFDQNAWGQNRLGKALMRVRERIQND